MQVALGRRGDYAVRILVDLARHFGQGRRKAREIAATMDGPQQYLAQVLTPFVRQGTVSAVAGREGGYQLMVAPSMLTLLDVVETAEGPIETGECTLRGGPCDWSGPCPLHETWVLARRQLADVLASVTFEQLAANDALLEAAQPRGTTRKLPPSNRRGVRTSPGSRWGRPEETRQHS